MKISELVKLRNDLQRHFDFNKVISGTDEIYQNLEGIRNLNSEYITELHDLMISVARIDRSIQPSQDRYSALILDIERRIFEQADKEGYCDKEFIVSPQENEERGKGLVLPDDIKNILLGRLRQYADWHYPGMEIGPQQGEFTHHLVGCDPLYLVDLYQETLDVVKAQFADGYQNRLRTYCLDPMGSWTNKRRFKDLPQNQFGFVFSWNFFNYVSLAEIEKYLIDMHSILRPGGVCLLGYNNGDTVNGAKHAEWGGMSFIPKSAISHMCNTFGYETIESFDFETEWHNYSWMELKKPGTLETTKAHQAMGLVKNISE